MKRKEFEKQKQKSLNELLIARDKKKKSLVNAKLDHKLGKLRNIRLMKMLKQDIAQLETIISEKNSQQESAKSEKSEK